jgi:hypothetical protein
MSVAAERLRDDLFELGLDVVDRLPGSKTSPVADAVNGRVDREGLLAERSIEDHIGGLSADAG